MAVQLDRPRRRRGVCPGLWYGVSSGSGSRPRTHLHQRGAPKQPFPPPGTFLAVRRGEAQNRREPPGHVQGDPARDAGALRAAGSTLPGHSRELRPAIFHLPDVRQGDAGPARRPDARLPALLHSLHQHLEYLRVTDPNRIQQELAGLQRSLASDPVKVQEINRKRIEILTKRLEKFGKIHENCDVINAQCAATEDVLQLIRDQSVTLRDPQQVSDQLEGLVRDVEQTEESVREMESIFEMATPDMTTPFGALPSESASSTVPRNRLRN